MALPYQGRVTLFGGNYNLAQHTDVLAFDEGLGEWVQLETEMEISHSAGAAALVPVTVFDACAIEM